MVCSRRGVLVDSTLEVTTFKATFMPRPVNEKAGALLQRGLSLVFPRGGLVSLGLVSLGMSADYIARGYDQAILASRIQ